MGWGILGGFFGYFLGTLIIRLLENGQIAKAIITISIFILAVGGGIVWVYNQY